MRTTAVIPTLNEESVIGRTLTAVCSQSVPFDQVLVVDGGSTDATVSIASSFAGVEVIQSCPPVGHQRQAGLEKAAGNVVFFLDADTSPGLDFVASCLAEMERRNLDIACPWYQPETSSPAIGAVYTVFNLIFIALQRVLPSGAGSCIIVKRDLALKAGGFREELVYEDIEFIRRAARIGRFGALRTRIGVSDRRFRRYGVLRTAGKYALLSLFFTFGMFKQAGLVPYRFADYESGGEELVVLVDAKDRPIGTAAKSKVHGSCTPLHRAFSVFLFNPRGEVLLQQRSESKVTWPLAWSNSCCGHPRPGESSEQAAERRIREELGIEAVGLRVILPDFRYRAEHNGIVENEICPVLIGFVKKEPAPDPAEVKAVRWVSWPELLELAGCEGALTPWCVQEALLLESSELFHRTLSSRSDGRISC